MKWDDKIFQNLRSTIFYKQAQNFLVYYDEELGPLLSFLRSDNKRVDYIHKRIVYYTGGDNVKLNCFSKRVRYDIFLAKAESCDRNGDGYSHDKKFGKHFKKLCLDRIIELGYPLD